MAGSIIFDYAHFGNEYMNILTASAFNDGTLHKVDVEDFSRPSSICTKCRKDKKCKRCRKLEKQQKKEMEKRAKKNK
jgi:G:T/U-mismatch repair DNA glycosylase